jgi:hypothetical protein
MSTFDIEVPIHYSDIDETLYVYGRLDIYYYNGKKIVDSSLVVMISNLFC